MGLNLYRIRACHRSPTLFWIGDLVFSPEIVVGQGLLLQVALAGEHREVHVGFAVGDQVVHPVYGVGVVKGLSTQQFAVGHSHQYYEVDRGGSIVWVPVDGPSSSALRAIAPKQTVDECRQLLSNEPARFSSNHTLRQNEIANRMKGGLLPAICRTVRDLRARSWTTALTAAEDALLSRLFKALCAEWAASDGVSTACALLDIEAYCARRCYMLSAR